MADVDVDHRGIIMVSAVVVGSTADLDSADPDLSEVTTNLPSMTVPSTTVTPGWVVIILSLVPLLWQSLVVTCRGEELTDLRVLLSYLVHGFRSSNLASLLDVGAWWLCLYQGHLLLLRQVLHLYRQ
jgi:hypothetical protein